MGNEFSKENNFSAKYQLLLDSKNELKIDFLK